MRAPRLTLAVSAFVLLSGVLVPRASEACMAVNSPTLRLMRASGAKAGGRVNMVGYFSKYDCYAMTPKTYCAIGVRFEPSDLLKKTDIKIEGMRFIDQDTGKPLTGFEPKANAMTSKTFNEKKKGNWFGYSALFGKKTEKRGGVEMKVEFSVAPGTTDEQIKALFAGASVGASGAQANGAITSGHHQEIVEVGKVFVVGDKVASTR